MQDEVTGDTGLLKAWCITIYFQYLIGGIIKTEIPYNFSLSQNYPNPFNPKTKIRFQAPLSPPKGRKQNITLIVYDVLGREVTTLFSSPLERSGEAVYEVEFDGTNYPSGVYFYQLSVFNDKSLLEFTDTKRMVLIK